MADIYRQVYTSFWQDGFIMTLTPNEKYFYLYLITNSKTTLYGIYELPVKLMEFETGYTYDQIENLLKKFESYGKIKYSRDTNEICVRNFLKYNANRSPKVKSAIDKGIESIKNKDLIPYVYGIDTVSSVTVTETVTVTGTVTVTETETETEKSSNLPAKKIKHKYGEYKHVLLSDEEFEKLNSDYGNTVVLSFIKKVDEYCQQYGKKYKDYNLTIRKWIDKDKPKEVKNYGTVL